MKNNKPAGWVSPSSHQAAQTPIMERLAKERQERQEAYEREKREKEEKHRKAIEDIRQRGKQLLMQDVVPNQRQAAAAAAEEETRPLIRRADSAQGQQRTPPKPAGVAAEPGHNVFKMDEQPKPKTPGFGGGNAGDAWPQSRPMDEVGHLMKSYIKDMNKLIDDEKSNHPEDEEDDDDDDDNIEEIPTVPETDENQK